MSDMSESGDAGQFDNAAPDTTGVEGFGPAPSVQEAQAPPKQDDGPDHQARLDGRLAEMAEQNQRLLAQFEQMQSRLAEPADDDYDDGDYDDPDPDDPGFEEWQQQQAMNEWLNAALEERLAPIQQQQMIDQRNTAYNRLVEQFPQMGDQAFANTVVGPAADLAESIGLSTDDPRFVGLIELQYKAHVADEAAKREKPAGERPEVRLESGGGAAPADRDEDVQDRLMKGAVSANDLI